MSRQSFCVACYTLGVLALFFMNAPVYAFLVAATLVIASFSEQVVAAVMRHYQDSESDDPEELESLQRRIYH